MRTFFFALTMATMFAGIFLQSCRHELVLPFDDDPQDTIPSVDTGDVSGVPCDPDTVYFQNQVLPLLISHCAKSGCHDAASHEDGVVLTDYQRVMSTGEVRAFKPFDSKLYESIIETDLDDRMPLSPEAPLTTEQQNLIRKWIEQGALNNVCNENYGGCSTDNVTYTNFVRALMVNQCTGCHGGNNPSAGVKLTTYAEVRAAAQNGQLYGTIARLPGYAPMPNGGAALSTCVVDKIKAWVDAGAPE